MNFEIEKEKTKSFDFIRDLHTDVVNMKAGKTNNDGLPFSEIQTAFK